MSYAESPVTDLILASIVFSKSMPVVASSALASVSFCATIVPVWSTPRWSVFQSWMPFPPCLASAHSPSPKMASPLLSMTRWIAPLVWRGRSATFSLADRRESVV